MEFFNLIYKINVDYTNFLMFPNFFKYADVLPNSNGEYTCDRCDRAFKDKELLFRHAACHDEEKPFECSECGKKFAKAGLLRDHRKRHFEVGAFECGWCKKRFYTPNKVSNMDYIFENKPYWT